MVLTSTPEKKKLEDPQRFKSTNVCRPLFTNESGSGKKAYFDLKLQEIIRAYNNKKRFDFTEDEESCDREGEEEDTESTLNPAISNFNPTNIKAGDFLLARFKGGRRDSTNYRFVVQVDAGFNQTDPGWIRVRGYKYMNTEKTKFRVKENDDAYLPLTDVICTLREPTMIVGRGIAFEFCGPVDIKEA